MDSFECLTIGSLKGTCWGVLHGVALQGLWKDVRGFWFWDVLGLDLGFSGCFAFQTYISEPEA